jgi:YD repeat-containing protein
MPHSSVPFAYDPFGRRIRKVAPAGAATIYVYDGSNIEEELNADGSLGERYTYGPGIDEPLVRQREKV